MPLARDFYVPHFELIVSSCFSLIQAGDRVTVAAMYEAADRLKPGYLGRIEKMRPSLIEEAVCSASLGSLTRDAEAVRKCSMLRRQLAMFEATVTEIRERGAEDPIGVLEDTQRAMREADGVTVDARRAITRGDDVELAYALMAMLAAGGEKIVFTREKFWRYTARKGIWEPVTNGEQTKALASLGGIQFGPKGEVLSLRAGRIKGAKEVAQGLCEDPHFFDVGDDGSGPAAGLCFRNGFVRVSPEGVELAPHSPAHRATIQLPFDFIPAQPPLDFTCPSCGAGAGVACWADETGRELEEPHAARIELGLPPAPRWRRYIAEVFPAAEDAADRQRLLREFVGICLAGRAAKYAKAPVLYGTGRNGKGTFLEVIRALFPANAVSSYKPSDFSEKSAGGEANRARAGLAGKLINLVGELDPADFLDATAWKGIVAGDHVTGRKAYGRDDIDHAPIAGHCVALDRKITTQDASFGLWNRLFIVHFNRRFEERQREIGLADKIKAAELPGVATWALCGAVDLMRRGYYLEPPSSRALVDAWRTAADPVRSWLEEACEKVDAVTGHWTKASLLYNDFKAWCIRTNHRPVNNNNFADRLREAGVERVRASGHNSWHLLLRGEE